MSKQYQCFEGLKHHTADSVEHWSARALAPLLEYRDWRNFEKVIRKAMQACEASNHEVANHFVEATKMVPLGSGSQRKLNQKAIHRRKSLSKSQKTLDHMDSTELAANLFRATKKSCAETECRVSSRPIRLIPKSAEKFENHLRVGRQHARRPPDF